MLFPVGKRGSKTLAFAKKKKPVTAGVGLIYFLLTNAAPSSGVAAAVGPSAGPVRQVPESRALNNPSHYQMRGASLR